MNQSRLLHEPDSRERTRFFTRQVVLPADLTQDQWYFLDKLRRHNRLLHGWGPYFGATIANVPQPTRPTTGSAPPPDRSSTVIVSTELKGRESKCVKVAAGFVLTPPGDEIYIRQDVYVDTGRAYSDGTLRISDTPCQGETTRSVARAGQYYFAISATEAETRLIRAAFGRCGDHPEACESSRIEDTFVFRLLPNDADYTQAPFPDDKGLLTGEPQSVNGKRRDYVLLGKVTIDANGNVTVDPNTWRDPFHPRSPS